MKSKEPDFDFTRNKEIRTLVFSSVKIKSGRHFKDYTAAFITIKDQVITVCILKDYTATFSNC